LVEHFTGPTSCDKDDADEWLIIYFGKSYECAFAIAAPELGMPSVTQMDKVAAVATLADANMTITHQRIMNKYLWHAFGSHIIVPETKQQMLSDTDTGVQPIFSGYPYYKKDNASRETDGEEEPAQQKAKNHQYWHCDVALSFMHDMEWVLECKTLIETCDTKNYNGWNLLIGTDHGKEYDDHG